MQSKFQKIIFVILLVFLPSQLGFHFWPFWAYINGIRVDYFSPTLYFTDILIGGMFVLELVSFFCHSGLFTLSIAEGSRIDSGCASPACRQAWLTRMTVGGLFLLFIFLNVYFSLSPLVSFYKWLKVLELGFLVWFVAKRLDREFLHNSYKFLLIPVVYESFLAFWQFLSQSSVGGVWYWLGERTFSSITPGIANAVVFGQLVLRPYGTFPHPNVLAGWMLVVMIILSALSSLRNLRSVVVFGLSTIFLTLSRSAIIGLFIALFFQIKNKLGRVVLLAILALLILSGSGFREEVEPFIFRARLNNSAIQQFIRSPLVGTGLGTSPLHDLSIRQPTHNIYLMLLAETGLAGFTLFIFLIKKSIFVSRSMLIPLSAILFLGLFDHYFLTLQQGQLLLALVFGLAVKNKV